jgi:hypothetical protein
MAKLNTTSTPGIREVVQKAVNTGKWVMEGRIGKHSKLRHVATGRSVPFGSTARCYRAAKNLERDLRHVEAGMPCWGVSQEMPSNMSLKQAR